MNNKIPKSTGIILVNGFTTNNSDFETIMPHLKHHQELMIISLPGDPNDISLKDYLPYNEWLKFNNENIQRMRERVKKLIVVGFSIGSVPACYFADKFKADKLILLSPVFNYATFDDATTSVARMVRSTIISKGKNDPVNSIKSLKYIGEFLKHPKQKLGQLFRVRIGPLMRPVNILLLPIYTLFEDEIQSIDSFTAKVVNKITRAKYEEFDFTDEDVIFATDDKTSTEIDKYNDEKQQKENKFVASVFRQIKRILPPDFVNLTYDSVYNMLKLLAYCDKYTSSIYAKLLIIEGRNDKELMNSNIDKLLVKFPLDNKKIISYPTDEHNLFGSKYYQEVSDDIISFFLK